VRQYYLRSGGEVGDMQVKLVDKSQRKDQSHAIATRLRPALQAIGQRMGANVKVVEMPPGPPVLAPIVAEVYGPDAEGRRHVAKAVRAIFEKPTTWWTWMTAASPPLPANCCWWTAAKLRRWAFPSRPS